MIMECSHYRQYMKFPKEVLVVGWGKWAPIYPDFSAGNFLPAAGMHIFFEILHVGYI